VQNLHARSVFFVKDAEHSLRFYTDTLGFTLQWNHEERGRAFVFQVALFGFQLILNQTEPWTENRAGHGRVFIGLDDDQVEPFRQHFREKNIKTTFLHWGAPTLVIRDVDENELFVWLPESERANLEAELADTQSLRSGPCCRRPRAGGFSVSRFGRLWRGAFRPLSGLPDRYPLGNCRSPGSRPAKRQKPSDFVP
jgi:catechol 2,3-dioxygenase-like lactoylglutathione lyase family enzyme